MLLNRIIILITLLASSSLMAFDQSHQSFDTLLKKYVEKDKSQTLFKYKALKESADDIKNLDKYLNQLSEVDKSKYSKFKENEKLSFLINLYNAYTIKLVVDNYPVKSIKEIRPKGLLGRFSSPWEIKFIPLFGKKITLDDVEHQMIRKDFKEARIHFAVNCASIGCPSLYNEAFTSIKLEKQLEIVSKSFVTNIKKNKYDAKNKVLHNSKIFSWYGGDFDHKYGSYLKFMAKYITNDPIHKKLISENKIKVKSLDYSWKLNESK